MCTKRFASHTCPTPVIASNMLATSFYWKTAALVTHQESATAAGLNAAIIKNADAINACNQYTIDRTFFRRFYAAVIESSQLMSPPPPWFLLQKFLHRTSSCYQRRLEIEPQRNYFPRHFQQFAVAAHHWHLQNIH
jgi:hypothetical protein